MTQLKIILGGLALVLAGCNDSKTAADGYYFETAQTNIVRPQITIHKYRTQAEIRDAHGRMPNTRELGRDETLQAFSVIDVRNSQCDIHMIDPIVSYQPEFIGHELTHCLYGNFHPKQDAERSSR